MTAGVRLVLLVLPLAAFGFASDARAHCDTLNGPVVAAARTALAANDVTPALKWVREPEEGEVREAFRQAMAVRGLGPAARDLADRFFFETVVRLHRLGEGEPYTGLKPDTAVDEAIERADVALRTGDVDALVALTTEHVAAGVRGRFARARALAAHADESVAQGRQYVAAYVELIHFVEAIGAQHKD
jgi:hypothetical protein